MTGDGEHPRDPRTARAIVLGLAAGVALSVVAAAAFDLLPFGSRSSRGADASRTAAVDLFRLPSGTSREFFLLPAGPDGIGEPELAAALFPGEDPPRELASVVLANVSASEDWDVDLAAVPLLCRGDAEPGWEELELLEKRMRDPSAGLSPADELRIRTLGGGLGHVTVEPSSVRRILVALPARRTLAGLSDVRWGETPLVRDRLELERVRRFRENPVAATTGR